jgi:hypothetical protein
LIDKEKTIVVAKGKQRESGSKETAVFHRDRHVSPARLANFKRRKGDNGFQIVSPNSGEISS